MRFSEIEISELTKAWLVISLAFAITWRGVDPRFWLVYLMAALTVGIAFLIHELSHKYVAQRFGCWAEFRSFPMGLALSVLMSFLGFIFAAPGAVIISGLVTRDENGKISAAGPIANIVLATIFYLLGRFGLGLLSPHISFSLADFLRVFLGIGVSINSWLALFNLLPFGPLDGVKIMQWSQRSWLLLLGVSILLVFFL